MTLDSPFAGIARRMIRASAALTEEFSTRLGLYFRISSSAESFPPRHTLVQAVKVFALRGCSLVKSPKGIQFYALSFRPLSILINDATLAFLAGCSR